MGIIARQSIYNVVSIAFGLLLGALNTLYLYPTYLGKEFQGIIIALLAYSNLIQPFISMGLQHALIKFYSLCKTKQERDRLLWFSILIPLLMVLIFLPVLRLNKEVLLAYLSNTNSEMGRYAYLILIISISCAYFEVFYSWVRVQFKTIFGNFLKEFYPRFLIFTLLIIYAFGGLSIDGFMLFLIAGYYIRLAIIIGYSLWVYRPTFEFYLPEQWKSIMRYSLMIFMAGAAASFILDIDKSMISNLIEVENVAFYAVALFISSVVETPGRAVFQIISPMVANAINNNDHSRLKDLLKESAVNILIISSLIFLIINLNLNEFYQLINLSGYEAGIGVVLVVSVGRLFSMSLGCLNTIITNSKYYRYVLWFSISNAIMAVVLNFYFIQSYGIMGAAYASLIVLVIHNLLKIVLIFRAYHLHPFGMKTIYILLTLLAVYAIVYYIPVLTAAPFWMIVIKTGVIFLLFSTTVLSFGFSENINTLYRKMLKKLF